MGKDNSYIRKPLGQREARIARRMKSVLGIPVTKIALALERNKSSVYKALAPTFKPMKRGPMDKLSKADVSKLARVIKALCKTARARWEVTMAMAKKRANVKACDGTVRRALRKRGIRFRKMRTKPRLTSDDIKARKMFAAKYRFKSKEWWQTHVDLFIDLKNFPVFTNAQTRSLAAQREVRGAYRQAGQGLDEAYVVIPKDLKWNPGAKAVRIAGGVGKGRVRLWEEIDGAWNGAKAAKLYSGAIKSALKRASPKKKNYILLEDNDPAGFKSSKGLCAKKASKINVLAIPKRSPDLSVMDYAIWKQINRNMRAQERRWTNKKRESRAEYVSRLSRTAKNLSRSFVNKAIGNMRERCRRLHEAKGKHFEEGGHANRS